MGGVHTSLRGRPFDVMPSGQTFELRIIPQYNKIPTLVLS